MKIPRSKKAQQLPNILGERGIRRLFNALTNKKRKAILFTAYSAGLRVSEVVNLQLKDIDSDRMQLFKERAKGKKDRYVNLSPVLLDVLRNYIQVSNPRPLVYLFEGKEPGFHLQWKKCTEDIPDGPSEGRYQHVKRDQLINIVSPLDDIWKEGNLEWKAYLRHI